MHKLEAHVTVLPSTSSSALGNGTGCQQDGCISTITYQQVGGVTSTRWIRVAQSFTARLYLGGAFF